MKQKIFLVTLSPKTHRTSEENLGIAYLKSSLLKKGYEVEIIDAWLNEYEVEDVFKKIIQEKDKILFVGISSYMSNTIPTIELINKIKSYDNEIQIVSGGFGPTFYPEEYLRQGADYVIRGEGEEAICELADSITAKQVPVEIKNICYKNGDKIIMNKMRCLKDNLDSIPFPSRDTIDTIIKKKSTVNMVTARGCSGNCEFCSVISFFRLSNGKVWRTRSIKNIVDEIEMLYKKGVRYIKMVDDSFIDGTRNEKWCKEFADEIEKRNLKVKLRGQIRADKVSDEILFHLKRAGFFSFACGIENGSPTSLARMNKKATLEDNRKALHLFKKYGYIVQMGYILFDKYTTFRELEENYEFMKEYDYTVTKGIFSEMFSAEGTQLNEKLKANHELIEGSFLSNNNKYVIEDTVVRKVYDALKMWHKSHSIIYDMTIDPLTAPKAISEEELYHFYDYTMLLKQKDLEFFKKVLLEIKKNSNVNIEKFVETAMKDTTDYFENISVMVRKLYRKNELEYHASQNPFI